MAENNGNEEFIKEIKKLHSEPDLRRLNIDFELIEKFVETFNEPVSSEMITDILKSNVQTQAVISILRIFLNSNIYQELKG